MNKDGEWALNRLSDAHDIHVPLCPPLLSEFNGMKYAYAHTITRQYMLASAAFIIENPGRAGDTKAMNLAAVESGSRPTAPSSSKNRKSKRNPSMTCSRNRARESSRTL